MLLSALAAVCVMAAPAKSACMLLFLPCTDTSLLTANATALVVVCGVTFWPMRIITLLHDGLQAHATSRSSQATTSPETCAHSSHECHLIARVTRSMLGHIVTL